MPWFDKTFAGIVASVLISVGAANAAALKTLYSVSGPVDGAYPSGLLYMNKVLYGTTSQGGAVGFGTLFALNTVTDKERVVHSFDTASDKYTSSPAGMINVNGTFYGIAQNYGISQSVVISANPVDGTIKVVCSVPDGQNAGAPLLAANGKLYGTTALSRESNFPGTIFSVDLATGLERELYAFQTGTDGAEPSGSLVYMGNKLYGTTNLGGVSGYGTVFSFDTQTGREQIIHSFSDGKDGSYPESGLIAVGGILYGTTVGDGINTPGTFFSIDPVSGMLKVLHAFGTYSNAEIPGTLTEFDGFIYGTTSFGDKMKGGTIFSMNLATGAEKVLYTFSKQAGPPGELICINGSLYGFTFGGNSESGTLFTIDMATGSVKFLYNLKGAPRESENNLLNLNGTILLSASAGGHENIGEVVKIVTSTDALSELYEFGTSNSGAYPSAALVGAGGGTLVYGTTTEGGQNNLGTVFSLDYNTGAERVIYSFEGAADAEFPTTSLISFQSKLYGTIEGSNTGLSPTGALFSVDPTKGALTVLYQFSDIDGGFPQAALLNLGGALYGSTTTGGAFNAGTVYSFNPGSRTEKVIYNFMGGNDGASPEAALTDLAGKLYGTTASGCGTVFLLNLATKTEEVIYSFRGGHDSCSPRAAMVNVGGMLYGTAYWGGTFGYGTIFSINPATKIEKILYNFDNGPNGGQPDGSLVYIAGTLYGTTSGGGAMGRGTMFELQP